MDNYKWNPVKCQWSEERQNNKGDLKPETVTAVSLTRQWPDSVLAYGEDFVEQERCDPKSKTKLYWSCVLVQETYCYAEAVLWWILSVVSYVKRKHKEVCYSGNSKVDEEAMEDGSKILHPTGKNQLNDECYYTENKTQ